MDDLQPLQEKKMNNQEKLEIWRRKIIELEGEIGKLENSKISLSNISNEIKSKQNPKLEISLEWTDLDDELSYLNDWIEYHQNEIAKYNAKVNELKAEKELQSLEETKKQVKLLFEPKEEKESLSFPLTFFPLNKLLNKNLVKYGLPVLMSLLIISIFLVAKPEITGQVILGKEASYVDELNLEINESGAYEWNVKNPGGIKSIKATGNVIGNGSVRIYIEKDGKRYLIYSNKP